MPSQRIVKSIFATPTPLPDRTPPRRSCAADEGRLERREPATARARRVQRPWTRQGRGAVRPSTRQQPCCRRVDAPQPCPAPPTIMTPGAALAAGAPNAKPPPSREPCSRPGPGACPPPTPAPGPRPSSGPTAEPARVPPATIPSRPRAACASSLALPPEPERPPGLTADSPSRKRRGTSAERPGIRFRASAKEPLQPGRHRHPSPALMSAGRCELATRPSRAGSSP